MSFKPYTYLIGWSELNCWYYGCQYNGQANPKILWKTYFTSSKHVKAFREIHGEPDVIQIRKIFDTADTCREWEHKVLRRMKVIISENWLNKTDNKSIDMESILRGARQSKNKGTKARVGKKHRPESIQLMKDKRKGKGTRDQLTPALIISRSRGGIKSGYAAHRNKTGIHAFSKDQKQQVAIKGKNAFLEKMKNPEFQQLHKNKIRLGRLISRFNRLPKPELKYFGFV